jgi:hypothetical protein
MGVFVCVISVFGFGCVIIVCGCTNVSTYIAVSTFIINRPEDGNAAKLLKPKLHIRYRALEPEGKTFLFFVNVTKEVIEKASYCLNKVLSNQLMYRVKRSLGGVSIAWGEMRLNPLGVPTTSVAVIPSPG